MLVRCSSPVRGGKAKEKKEEDKKRWKALGVPTHVHVHANVRSFIHTGANARARVTWGEAFFLVRLSRQRFIPRSRKTNGKIVSKILTAHLGEHVLAPRGYSLHLLSHLIRPSSMPVPV